MIDEDLLRRIRRDGAAGRPVFHPWLTFYEDQTEFGIDDLLAQLVWMRGGEFRLYFEGARERAKLRLDCAYMRPIADADFDDLLRAALDWRKGDRALAYIKLSLTHLGKFDEGEASSHWVDVIPRDANDFWHWPWVGWLTYFNREDSHLVHPPADVRSERLSSGGLLMTLSNKPVDPDNPVHLARMREANEALRTVREAWRSLGFS